MQKDFTLGLKAWDPVNELPALIGSAVALPVYVARIKYVKREGAMSLVSAAAED